MSDTKQPITTAAILERIADRASELTGVSAAEIRSELEHGVAHRGLPHPGGSNWTIINRIVSVQVREAVEQAIAEISREHPIAQA